MGRTHMPESSKHFSIMYVEIHIMLSYCVLRKLQGVAEAECRRAASAAEDAYRSAFDDASVAPEPEALAAEHQVSG